MSFNLYLKKFSLAHIDALTFPALLPLTGYANAQVKCAKKSLKFALSLLQIYVNYLTCYNWYIKWFKSLPMRQHKQKSIEKKAKAQKKKAKAKKQIHKSAVAHL